MDITSKIMMTAREKFGIEVLKPFQLLVMQRIVEQDTSDDVTNQTVILPTGTGKSLCFLVPSLLCRNITVIIYPLLALMNDQLSKLRRANVDCVCLRGGQTAKQRDEIFEKLRNGTKIIITNPETLIQKKVLERLEQFKVSLMVVDEAHVIAAWGESFRPAYSQLNECVKSVKPHQIVAFTATASEHTLEVINSCLFGEEPLVVRGDADRENIFYAVWPVVDRTAGLIELLKICEKPVLVFCNRRNDTYRLCCTAMRLMHGVPMRYYHAGLTKNERETLEKWFIDSTDGILFSTNAFGMGIDAHHLRTVIHHRIPSDVEAYLQESGRAGRDGLPAKAWAIVSEDEKSVTGNNAVLMIFTENKCRRSALLKILEQDKEECTGCDVCSTSKIEKPLCYETVISLIREYPFEFTAVSASLLLCGADRRYRLNPYFAVLSDTDTDLLRDSIRKMTADKTHPYRPLGTLFRGKLYVRIIRKNRVRNRFVRIREGSSVQGAE